MGWKIWRRKRWEEEGEQEEEVETDSEDGRRKEVAGSWGINKGEMEIEGAGEVGRGDVDGSRTMRRQRKERVELEAYKEEDTGKTKIERRLRRERRKTRG